MTAPPIRARPRKSAVLSESVKQLAAWCLGCQLESYRCDPLRPIALDLLAAERHDPQLGRWLALRSALASHLPPGHAELCYAAARREVHAEDRPLRALGWSS